MIRAIGAYTLSECMEIMAQCVADSEKANPARRNIVFCEDRLTLIAERAMMQKLGGSFRSYVTTYARALKSRGRVLTKQGSVMVIDGIVSALQKEGRLKRFSRGGMPRGTAKSLYETIAQSAASSVNAEVLKSGADRLENGILKDKISDIAEIYAEYEKFLKQNAYVDESGYLALLPEYLKATGELDGANVYFLCYGSFTSQAAKTLKASFERAENVTGIFCFGKEDFYTGGARFAFLKAAEEFQRESGNPKDIIRAENKGVPLDKEAEVMRTGLFNPTAFSRGANKYRTDAIRLFEAEDKNDEAEKIAVAIKSRMSREASFRYRDFAVLVSDIKAYTPAVKKAFSQFNIPFFLDEKRSLKTHPLSAFLLSCFEAVKTGLLPDSVDAVLANPFFGGADEYRNYLLKYANFRGGAKKEIKSANAQNAAQYEENDGDGGALRNRKNIAPEYDEAELKVMREKLLTLLSPVRRQANGGDYCRAVREILRYSCAETRLKEMTESIKDVALKGYLGQIGGAIERLLCECETLLGNREMSVAEFENVLSDGLDATEISLIPVKSDAVFVGDINESRIEKVRILFAAGMNENVPKTTSDTALISDREIEKLADVKAKIEPTVAEVNLRGRENTALNLCTFTEGAYFSYALPADGTEAAVSEVLKYVSALFCTNEGGALEVKKGWEDEAFVYRCSAPAPARLCWYEQRERDEINGVLYSERCNALEQALARFEEDGVWAQAAMTAEEKTGFVSCGESLFFHSGKISPSALETYFSCPFKHFLRYGLGVKEREEQSVMATDSGNFIHELLQRAAMRFSDYASEEEAREAAREIGEELLKKPPYCFLKDTSSGEYAAKRLLAEGIEASVAAFRQVKGSLYRVAETEKTVETPFFRGKIDRVDETDDFVRVVDYKTGRIDDSPSTYYTGEKIQLQLYMTAAKGDKIPAGVFYFPASLAFSEESVVPFKMKGFFCGDGDALNAGDPVMAAGEKGTESEFFTAKNGETRNTHSMDRLTFSDFIDYSTYVSSGARKEIAQGFIGVSPHKEACKFCSFGGVCGFHPDKTACREDDFTVSPERIASIVRQKREEENAGITGGETVGTAQGEKRAEERSDEQK